MAGYATRCRTACRTNRSAQADNALRLTPDHPMGAGHGPPGTAAGAQPFPHNLRKERKNPPGAGSGERFARASGGGDGSGVEPSPVFYGRTERGGHSSGNRPSGKISRHSSRVGSLNIRAHSRLFSASTPSGTKLSEPSRETAASISPFGSQEITRRCDRRTASRYSRIKLPLVSSTDTVSLSSATAKNVLSSDATIVTMRPERVAECLRSRLGSAL